MIHRELSRQLQALESLFNRTNDACGDDIEMRAHWAKYMCVLCAGFMENALCAVYGQFCTSAASGPVAAFAIRNLERIQNPKTPRFLEIAASFKKNWSEELAVFVDENGRREAIDSIMQNRHLIAHGKKSDITVVRVKEYFKKCVEVIEFIEKQCNE